MYALRPLFSVESIMKLIPIFLFTWYSTYSTFFGIPPPEIWRQTVIPNIHYQSLKQLYLDKHGFPCLKSKDYRIFKLSSEQFLSIINWINDKISIKNKISFKNYSIWFNYQLLFGKYTTEICTKINFGNNDPIFWMWKM